MRRILLCLVLGLSSGCATIFSGTSQDVMVSSNPTGAKATVMIDGAIVATVNTPATVTLKRKGATAIVDVTMDGYMPVRVLLEKGVAGWYWVNMLDFVGMIIDISTGAAYKYTPDQIAVTLTKMPSASGISALGKDDILYAAVDFMDEHSRTFKRVLIPVKTARPQ